MKGYLYSYHGKRIKISLGAKSPLEYLKSFVPPTQQFPALPHLENTAILSHPRGVLEPMART